jgi:hypothetical protein
MSRSPLPLCVLPELTFGGGFLLSSLEALFASRTPEFKKRADAFFQANSQLDAIIPFLEALCPFYNRHFVVLFEYRPLRAAVFGYADE